MKSPEIFQPELTQLTRTKTSIRYAKENDREKGRRRDIEREGGRERERDM